jgi:hypothetical protein
MKYLTILLLFLFIISGCKEDSPTTSPPESDFDIVCEALRGSVSNITVTPYFNDSITVSFNYAKSDSFYCYDIFYVANDKDYYIDSAFTNNITLHFSDSNDNLKYFYNAHFRIDYAIYYYDDYFKEYMYSGGNLFRFHIDKKN